MPLPSLPTLSSLATRLRAPRCVGARPAKYKIALSHARKGVDIIIGAVYTHCPALPCPLPCRTALLPHTAAQLPWPARSPTCPGCETHTALPGPNTTLPRCENNPARSRGLGETCSRRICRSRGEKLLVFSPPPAYALCGARAHTHTHRDQRTHHTPSFVCPTTALNDTSGSAPLSRVSACVQHTIECGLCCRAECAPRARRRGRGAIGFVPCGLSRRSRAVANTHHPNRNTPIEHCERGVERTKTKT